MNSNAAVAVLALASLLGCTDAGGPPIASGASAPSPSAPMPSPRPPASPIASAPRISGPVSSATSPSRWLAATDGGASIALVASDGSLVAKARLPPGEIARDLVADPLHDRALVFALDEDDGYGELVVIPVGPTSLGAVTHLAWIDGDAHFATDGAVLLAFERSYGDAWKRLDPEGATLPRWPAPPPLAVVPTAPGLGVLFVDDGGELSLSHVVSGGAWPPPAEPIGVSLTMPASARLVASGSADAWLFEGSGGELSVRRAVAGSVPHPLAVDFVEAELEAALSFDQGSRIALLASGRAVLIALTLDPSGQSSDLDEIALGEAPASGGDWASEALAVIGPTTLAVATSSGVLAFDAGGGGLARDLAFDGSSFSAPIASWP